MKLRSKLRSLVRGIPFSTLSAGLCVGALVGLPHLFPPSLHDAIPSAWHSAHLKTQSVPVWVEGDHDLGLGYGPRALASARDAQEAAR